MNHAVIGATAMQVIRNPAWIGDSGMWAAYEAGASMQATRTDDESRP